ncbi:MiaB/RimO family radical SAM methylthiotransferase [Streptomyces marincola]|uniref:Ribosomal protein uS12 methylthiotransferase RimO n=1 Tax=Streptomyces marincola TaxID=2878388 RepID=A0A1W7CTL4_9ACTN|nr:radical SAM protein [Streptomyces marincola]ARQ68154.1 30S ribosomal protein S12 methylthiotransferase RimO [Streptomyces marincola]
MSERRTVALVTLGCARNEVDSEELAGRLAADGWDLVENAADAEIAVVNTCGFVDAAKKDSVDALLEAGELKAAAAEGGGGATRAVVAVGCMAERYGKELADALPEADAVLGFDDYADISARLTTILSGGGHAPHVPRDRRKLLPLTPADRQGSEVALPGHGGITDLPAGVAPASGPRAPLRRRLGGGPVASVKLASGCDRRCTFCAIPSFRGSFISRRPADVLGEARWLAGEGVTEIMLVSENNTSYGKDLGDIRLLETLLPELAAIDGLERIRVSYLQPAEMRPGLIDVLTGTDKVAPYFDLSFQHSAPGVLRAMRRFGDTDRFLDLLASIRAKAPLAGVRSNFIVGFPGESEADVEELERFLTAARLDAIGVFGYSDEEGTEAAGHSGKHGPEEIADRLERISRLAEELIGQRAEERVGERAHVLVESLGAGEGAEDDEPPIEGHEVLAVGRGAHQAPETDGQVVLAVPAGAAPRDGAPRVGQIVAADIVAARGVDLVAVPRQAAGGEPSGAAR